MNEDDVIAWSKNYRLTWSDFNAESNPASFEDAYTYLKYRATWTVHSENFGKDIKFSISDIILIPEFHKHLSWVRKPLATNALLEHEQGHFDLAELVQREATDKIKNLFENKWYPTRGQNDEQQKQFAKEDSGSMINKEIDKLESILAQKQEDYDIQTDYGQNYKKQVEFNSIFTQLR